MGVAPNQTLLTLRPMNGSDLKRCVITGGTGVGKSQVFSELGKVNQPCSEGELGREIYQRFRIRLGRHLLVEDRREYSLEVLKAFIREYQAHTTGLYFYNRGIPDGFGWESFFGLQPSQELIEATKQFRYDRVFILDPVTKFEDSDDVVWPSEREAARVHQLIIQGYVNAGYEPIFVPADFIPKRVRFILSNL